jgi:putative membrane protein (TIGR04086 family)
MTWRCPMDKSIHQNTRILAVLKGLLLSYIVTAFILLILAFFMLNLDLSSIVISGGINFVYIISAFIGGFFVGKKVEQRKFLWGLVMGVFYFIVVMLISLFLNRVTPLSMGSLFTVFIISSLSGMLGGMIS